MEADMRQANAELMDQGLDGVAAECGCCDTARQGPIGCVATKRVNNEARQSCILQH